MHLCEACREPVEPGDPDVVQACEVVHVTTFGPTHQAVDGKAVLFHRHHFLSGSDAYRLLDAEA